MACCSSIRTPNLTGKWGISANIVRERLRAQPRAYYIRNQHINYTNICDKGCKFCSFYAKKRRAQTLCPHGWTRRVSACAPPSKHKAHHLKWHIGGCEPRACRTDII